MEHCVGGYISICFEGHSVIFSLRSEGHRIATIEVDPLTRDVVQMQGRFNAEPRKSHLSVVKKWMADIVHGRCYL